MLDDGKRKMPQTAVALAYQSGEAAPRRPGWAARR